MGLPAFQCSPERVEDGWDLGNCTGLEQLPQGMTLTMFVPSQGESGLEVRFHRGQFSFPVSLTRLPRLNEPQASANVSLAWHEPGTGLHADIWASGGLVFAPRLDGRIEILDAKSGQILGIARVPETNREQPNFVFDVKARDGVLYAATAFNGLVVFDVSQPATPEQVGQYRKFVDEDSPENFTNVHNIFLSPMGDLVYAINQSSPDTELRIIDVSDPASPSEVGRFTLHTQGGLESAHDINVMERNGRLIAFLNYLRAGLWILDVTDPASVSVLSSIKWDGIKSHSGWPFALQDKLYYVHSEEGYDRHLTILDVTDLADPVVLSHFSTRAGVSVHNVEVVEGIAYISYYIDGLRVVDLRDPEIPREIGHFDTVSAADERDIGQGAWGVRVYDGIVYVSDIETGIYAFKVDLE